MMNRSDQDPSFTLYAIIIPFKGRDCFCKEKISALSRRSPRLCGYSQYAWSKIGRAGCVPIPNLRCLF
jgi:hypothetical protein